MKPEKHISKFMSLVLRHRPEMINLQLDPHGWASIEELIYKMNQKGKKIDRALIEHIVATNNKKRFIISDDGERIRANQGHSIDVDLELQPLEPPKTLYHGTATRYLDSIYESGLEKRNRQHVHLTADFNTAKQVGKRHSPSKGMQAGGKVVILIVQSKAMHNAGFKFYQSNNGVWLTDNVPANYLAEAD
ncbi:MAG: RNA 2'-phosphotransferase [Bacteroidota bacterium]